MPQQLGSYGTEKKNNNDNGIMIKSYIEYEITDEFSSGVRREWNCSTSSLTYFDTILFYLYF